MGEEDIDSRGHRVRAHAAETVLEAWAPTKDECVAEAVHALVDSFADSQPACSLARPTPPYSTCLAA